MHTINIDHVCGCVRRSDLEINSQVESKDEALLKAIKMKDLMNQEFCGKHMFDIEEKENNFHIAFAVAKPSSSCCGGSAC